MLTSRYSQQCGDSGNIARRTGSQATYPFTEDQSIEKTNPALMFFDTQVAEADRRWYLQASGTNFMLFQPSGGLAAHWTKAGDALFHKSLTVTEGLNTTPLNANYLTSGVVPDARLSSNVQMRPVNPSTDLTLPGIAAQFLNGTGLWSIPPTPVRAGTIGITIDGAGAVITPGVKGFFEVGVACTITAVTLLSTDDAVTPGPSWWTFGRTRSRTIRPWARTRSARVPGRR